MNFDPISFAMGMNAAKGSGGSSERETIYSETKHNFNYREDFGAYMNSNMSLLFILEKDKEYTVVWDGNEYKRTAFEFTSADGANCVALGNPLVVGQADNGDIFAIVTDKTNSLTHFVSTEQLSEHTVAIYKGGSGVATVETSVELDFSNGDMEISAGEGKAFSKVDIPKPENLVAENIANGINIAGIIGKLVNGGSSVFKKGMFEATEESMTVEHGGNRVPDFLLIYIQGQPSNMNLFFTYGFSETMLAKLGGGSLNSALILNNASSMEVTSSSGIETSGTGQFSNYGGVRSVTDTTFRVGGAIGGGLKIGAKYSYIALYGLA